MFDIGFWEIMLISILAMVVIGPERLPKVARTAGHWFGKTRRFIEGVKGEVESEFDTSELKRLMHNQEVQIKELQSKLNEEGGNIRSGFSYNLEDENKEEQTEKPVEDDYLEFLDEDEEKDHEQIAAEKREKEQQTARESRRFENPAVDQSSADDAQELKSSSDSDKQKDQHD